jgi:hypothetical protein
LISLSFCTAKPEPHKREQRIEHSISVGAHNHRGTQLHLARANKVQTCPLPPGNTTFMIRVQFVEDDRTGSQTSQSNDDMVPTLKAKLEAGWRAIQQPL